MISAASVAGPLYLLAANLAVFMVICAGAGS